MDLRFRDETKSVTSKLQVQRSDRPWIPRRHISHDEPIHGQEVSFPRVNYRTLDLDLVDRAVPYFFSHYVHQPESFSEKSKRGYYEYLPTLYTRSGADSPLVTIVHAVAIASFANAGHVHKWISDGYKLYGSATLKAKAALENPKHAKSDDVLATVMLLGMFEVWISHN